MVIPVYDCEIDVYWWILCTKKYFERWGTLEEKKMEVVAIAMRGRALTWWLWWYPRHQSVSWDAFTALFLWQFKLEWRVILPVPDDDYEESSFQSASTDPNDILVPTNQIDVPPFVLTEDDGEHLVEENDDGGSSTPTATQTHVSILTLSNIDSELLVDKVDVVKSAFEANVTSKLFSYVNETSKVFTNLNPIADGSNKVSLGVDLRLISHLNRCCSGPFSQILEGATDIVVGDALLFNTIPYDPGPLESISHSTTTNVKSNGVSLVHF